METPEKTVNRFLKCNHTFKLDYFTLTPKVFLFKEELIRTFKCSKCNIRKKDMYHWKENK